MNLNIAVLIDGENIPSAHVQEMMEEIAKYETLPSREYMGTGRSLVCLNGKTFYLKTPSPYSAIQLYFWKNTSDSAMIIDAMDLLYSEKVNGFCLGQVIVILQSWLHDLERQA